MNKESYDSPKVIVLNFGFRSDVVTTSDPDVWEDDPFKI